MPTGNNLCHRAMAWETLVAPQWHGMRNIGGHPFPYGTTDMGWEPRESPQMRDNWTRQKLDAWCLPRSRDFLGLLFPLCYRLSNLGMAALLGRGWQSPSENHPEVLHPQSEISVVDTINDNFTPMKWFRQNKCIPWKTQFIKQSSEDMGPTFPVNNIIDIRFYYIQIQVNLKKSSHRDSLRPERWLSNQEHWILFQRTSVRLPVLPVPTRQPTIAYNSCFGWFSAVFWSVRTLHSYSIQQKCRQIHTHTHDF